VFCFLDERAKLKSDGKTDEKKRDAKDFKDYDEFKSYQSPVSLI
jgi:hypothetical protein